MSATQPRHDETTGPILSFLALVDYIGTHQPCVQDLLARFDISHATLKRRIALARACGVVIQCRRGRTEQYYQIANYGPFDPAGLARAVERVASRSSGTSPQARGGLGSR